MSINHRTIKSRILATSSVAALSLILYGAHGAPAFAQDGEEGEAQERIVVTGSRIVRQDFTANSPIVTVEPEAFENTTSLTVEAVLNQLPQFTQDARSEFRTTSVEPTADQTPGTAQVNLRGLGSNRSLVLIDGRRAMPVNAAMAIDVNSIPSSAIQRVEIISGGASAVYGADAVGGVVNFILRDNFEGMTLSARYGMTEQGDGENTQVSALFGADFDGGRGNVMFGGDLSNRGNVLFADRDWMVEQAANPFVISASAFGVTAPNLSTYNAATRLATGVRDRGPGAPGGNTPAQWVVDSIFNQAIPCDTNGSAPGGTPAPGTTCPTGSVPANSSFLLNADGTVFTSSVFAASSGPGGYRYNGPMTLDEYPGCPFRAEKADGTILEYACYQELASPLDRYTFFGRGRYELNEAVAVTLRGNYATTYTRSVLNPAGVTVHVPVGGQLWTGSDYSPSSLLSDGITTHPDYLPGGRYGLNCPATGGCTESQAFPLPTELATLLASRPQANEDIVLNSFLYWGDVRGSSTQTDVFQLEMGFEGDLGVLFPAASDWFWDVSVSHGETHILNKFTGFASAERFRAIALSPNFGRGFSAQGNAAFGGAGAGAGACTSGLPLMTDFEVTDDCIKAYEAVMQNSSQLEQNTIEANLTGDLFELPAGPLQFAAGASYRENNFVFTTDPLNDLANFYDQPFGLFPKENAAGYISVQEVYGELLVPVVADLPFVESFMLEIGGRISDNDPTGQVETYKLLGDWEITEWMRLRGGYNRATRAPNINELYAARAQTVAGGANAEGDPCSLMNNVSRWTARRGINATTGNPYNQDGDAGAAHTEEICRAIMERDSLAAGQPGSAGYSTFYDNRPAADHPTVGNAGTSVIKGNPTVEPESADTYTIGLVVTSPSDNPVLSGFSGSLDYYQIEISDLIAVSSNPALLQDCFSLATNPTADPNRFSCSRLIRDPLDGDGLFIDRTYTNQGWAKLSGVDLQVNWRGEFEDLGLNAVPGGAGVNFVATIPIEQLTQGSPTASVVDSVGTQYSDLQIGGGAYEYTTLTTFNYFVGDLSASLSWQYTPSIEASAYATDPNTDQIGVPKGASLFNLSGSYRLNDTVTFRAGVDNVLDKKPPLAGGDLDNTRFPVAPVRTIGGFGSSGAGAGAYDALGRRYFVGLTVSY
jgi:outer membrane receptor protein involved in Fe transport